MVMMIVLEKLFVQLYFLQITILIKQIIKTRLLVIIVTTTVFVKQIYNQQV